MIVLLCAMIGVAIWWVIELIGYAITGYGLGSTINIIAPIIMGTLMAIGGIPAQIAANEKKKQKHYMAERLKLISSGRWKFPIDKFYKECLDEKATNVTNAIVFKKIMLIAKNIINKEQIPQQYISMYYDEKKVKDYFLTGKERVQTAREKREQEEALKRITPQPAKLTTEMREISNLHYALRDKMYVEKRRLHLGLLINIANRKLQECEKTYDTAWKVSHALLHSTVQIPKNDWAVIGGLTQGIAGPAAGVMAALKASAENDKIVEINKNNMMAMLELSEGITHRAREYCEPIEKEVKKSLKYYKETLEQLPLKMFFEEYDKNELFNNLKISGSVSYLEKEIYAAEINISNKYNPNIKDYTIVMDGIIKVKWYCDDVFVDEFFIALPENGVKYNEEAVVIQYPKKYMIGKRGSDRFEFSPQSLWLMER